MNSIHPLRYFPYLGAAIILAHAINLRAGVVIQYALSGGNVYQYNVINSSLPPVPVTDFLIYFPDVSGPGEYTGLGNLLLNQPAGWTPSAVEPSAINLNGYVEWFTGGSGIAPGNALGGFEASFNYAGGGIPASQYFEVYDSAYNLVDSGWTTPVPEPMSAVACAVTLLAAAGLRRTWITHSNTPPS